MVLLLEEKCINVKEIDWREIVRNLNVSLSSTLVRKEKVE